MYTNNTTFTRKNDVIRLSGHVEELIFGKFITKHQRLPPPSPSSSVESDSIVSGTPTVLPQTRHSGGFEFAIARFKVDNQITIANTNTKPGFKVPLTNRSPVVEGGSMILLKGNLPYHSCYFDYVLTCVNQWDNTYHQEYYRVLSIVEVKLSSPKLSLWTCRWIICVENKMNIQTFIRIAGKYTGKPIFDASKIVKPSKTSKLPELVVTKFPNHEFSSTLYPNSEFYKWICGGPLLTLIPRDAHSILSHEFSTLYVDRILRTASDPTISWKLMTKRGRKGICKNLKHKPSIIWHVVDSNTISPLTKREEETIQKIENERDSSSSPPFVVTQRYDSILNLYRKMKHQHRKRACSTSFILPQSISDDMTVNRDIDELLCKEMRLLTKEIVDGQWVFTFTSDYEIQTKIIDFYKRLWTRWDDFPVLDDHYVMDRRLTDEQQRALNSVREQPMVNIIALPGRGKSFLIAEIGKKYKNVAVVTHVASLAAQLRIKVPQVITICSSIAKSKYDEKKRKLERGKDSIEESSSSSSLDREEKNDSLFGDIEVLVIDEAEDVENAQMIKLYSVFKHIKRIVHVFDPKQILPIGPGNLALDLASVMRKTRYNILLTHAFRFGSPGIISNSSHNDEKLLKRLPEEMIYHIFPLTYPVVKTIKDPFEMMLPNDRKDLVFVTPINNDDICDLKNLGRNIKVLDETITNFFSSEHSLICISLTNKYKDTINDFIENKKNPRGNIFYASQRITIVDNNFEQKRLDIINVDKRSFTIQNRQESIEQQKKDEAVEITISILMHTPICSHGVKNGESFIVKCIRDYNAITRQWVKGSKRNEVSLQEIRDYDKANLRRCIITTTDLVICIHPDFIPYSKVKPGWAITVDKAKGLEYENVLLTFDALKDKIFSINHLHVALTRAKRVTYILNTTESFRKLVKSPQTMQRFDLMEWRLTKWFKTEMHGSTRTIKTIEIQTGTKRKRETEKEDENRRTKRK